MVNRKVDEEMLNQLYSDGYLTEADNLCFIRKLSIVEGMLSKIDPKSNVWKAITEKPGMPKLEVTQHEA
jgi:predicted unusual protein kinase regulating ubiquinone biosynthesis (AarF/ABC1/UbiB family)